MNLKKITDGNFNSQLLLLERLVRIDSGSADIEGVNEVSGVVRRELEELGYPVQIVSFEKAGNCLIADFTDNAGWGARKILLLGHMDTVFPAGTAEKRPYTVSGNKAYGPGVLDMKGGISQIVFALKALKESGMPLNRIRVLLLGDEEVGHIDSSAATVGIMRNLSETTDYVFCCESGREDGKLVTGRNGVAGLTITAHGKSAHAGDDYNKGVNAIVELAHKIIRVQAFTEADLSLTLNVGYVTGGGAINVVPDFAEATFDIRIQDFDKYRAIEESLKTLCTKPDVPGTSCGYKSWLEYPSMRHSELTDRMLGQLGHVCEENGYPPIETCSVGGGADSSYFALFGVPVVCAFGPRGAKNHTDEEFIWIDSLRERTLFLAECVEYLLRQSNV